MLSGRRKSIFSGEGRAIPSIAASGREKPCLHMSSSKASESAGTFLKVSLLYIVMHGRGGVHILS